MASMWPYVDQNWEKEAKPPVVLVEHTWWDTLWDFAIPLGGAFSLAIIIWTSGWISFSTSKRKPHPLPTLSSSGQIAPEPVDDEKRIKILQEILETERTYVQSLKQLEQVYVEPLRATLPQLNVPPETMKVMFPPSIHVIRKTNEILLTKLEDRFAKSTRTNIDVSDIFVEMAPFFKCYTSFVNGQANTLQYHEVILVYKRYTCKSNSKYRNWIMQTHNETKADLPSLMITPVQRLPRYVLLLQELIKCSDPSNPKYKTAETALELMKGVTTHLNNNKQLAENLDKVLQVESKLGLSHSISRQFIKEGSITYFNNSTINKKKEVTCWLFNDCFVCAKERTSINFTKKDMKYQVVAEVTILGASIIERDATSFTIRTPKGDFDFFTKDVSWKIALQETIAASNLKSVPSTTFNHTI